MERTPIEIDSFHHVYNRGTDKRIIFDNKADYKKFTFYLNILNDTEVNSPVDFDSESREESPDPIAERLVNLVAFCLMPNHFHLLLQERTASGISKFMQRLSTAYTMYFNEKNERSGALFQGRFKSRLIDTELYLLKVIDYIHLNPRDLFFRSLANSGKVVDNPVVNLVDNGVNKPVDNFSGYLTSYEWSSYHHYCGRPKFAHLLQTSTLPEYTEIPKEAEYPRWIISQTDLSDIQHLAIDTSKYK